MKTLGLTSSWDLYLDSSGNLAVIDGDASTAQNVATACMTVKGEQIFDETLGIPMFDSILGHKPSHIYIQSQIEECAKTISNVSDALCIITKDKNRIVSGTIDIIDTDNNLVQVII